jgi:hypothetical protein
MRACLAAQDPEGAQAWVELLDKLKQLGEPDENDMMH